MPSKNLVETYIFLKALERNDDVLPMKIQKIKCHILNRIAGIQVCFYI